MSLKNQHVKNIPHPLLGHLAHRRTHRFVRLPGIYPGRIRPVCRAKFQIHHFMDRTARGCLDGDRRQFVFQKPGKYDHGLLNCSPPAGSSTSICIMDGGDTDKRQKCALELIPEIMNLLNQGQLCCAQN